MADFVDRILEAVTLAAERIHGLCSSRAAYQAALADELRAAGFQVKTDVKIPSCYDDVVVDHCLDMMVDLQVAVELKSATESLPLPSYISHAEFCLRKSGLSHGLVLDFAGNALRVCKVSLSGSHR